MLITVHHGEFLIDGNQQPNEVHALGTYGILVLQAMLPTTTEAKAGQRTSSASWL
jgi:hypothetical protein